MKKLELMKIFCITAIVCSFFVLLYVNLNVAYTQQPAPAKSALELQQAIEDLDIRLEVIEQRLKSDHKPFEGGEVE